MSQIDTVERVDHRHRQFLRTAALTVAATTWLVMIVAAATLANTSPAFAQQHAARLKGQYALTPAARSQASVDRNDPALAGGGSLGYNQLVERGY
jgi:hypothetical protein